MSTLVDRLDAHLQRCGRRCRLEAAQLSLLVGGPAALGGAAAGGVIGGGAVAVGLLALLGGTLGLAAVRCRGDGAEWAVWSSELEEAGFVEVVRDALAELSPESSAALGQQVGRLLVQRAATVPCVPEVPAHPDWPNGARLLAWISERACPRGGAQAESFRGALLAEAEAHALRTALADG
jgi:hypothetical protein